MAFSLKTLRRLSSIWRGIVQISFIIFLLYSILLMGEFTRANGQGKTVALAVQDIFTAANLAIAIISGFIGYGVIEYLRKKL